MHPAQLLDEVPNNDKQYRKAATDPRMRFGLNISACELVDTDGIDKLAARLFRPSHLVSLDLSCNRITKLTDLSCFKHLKILYLHGNELDTVDDIECVFKIPDLMMLTVHGNPLILTIKIR